MDIVIMKIILPLADNENVRINSKYEIIKIRTSDCKEPFNHIYFAEVGKLLYFSENYLNNFEDDEVFAFIQNRRFFKDLDDIESIKKDEVILSKEELIWFDIRTQFKYCHPKYSEIFNGICDDLKIPVKILNCNILSPHNIFIANKNFIMKYTTFIKDFLLKYFNEDLEDKAGAWMCERLLYVYCKMNYNLIFKDIIELEKL
jgi:hypothetical protein